MENANNIFNSNSFDWLQLATILKSGRINLSEIHYLYINKDEKTPTKVNDSNNLYFVIQKDNDKEVRIKNMVTGIEEDFAFNDLVGDWWVLIIPKSKAKNIGLD
jgi:hypothetical protein